MQKPDKIQTKYSKQSQLSNNSTQNSHQETRKSFWYEINVNILEGDIPQISIAN